MELDFSSMYAGLVFSTFGIYFIKRGKELGNLIKVLVGVGLLCDFLVPGVWTWIVGIALMVAGFKL